MMKNMKTPINRKIAHVSTHEMSQSLGQPMKTPWLYWGTGYPFLETYYNTIKGHYEKIVLSKRIGNQQLPPTEIVDMSEEVRERRGHHIISQRLGYYMNQALARNEQVILFLNRRGFAPHLHCKRCGFVLKCRKCDIPMTLQQKLNTALCHYCHAEAPPLESCPTVWQAISTTAGLAPEKIEDEIIAKFLNTKFLRMDSDTHEGAQRPRNRR